MISYDTSNTISCVGGIMLLGFWPFKCQLIHVVVVTFTALILSKLLIVILTITTWHGLMILAEIISSTF